MIPDHELHELARDTETVIRWLCLIASVTLVLAAVVGAAYAGVWLRHVLS